MQSLHGLRQRGVRSLALAVSGGADSVGMLHCMHARKAQLGFELHVIHVNHLQRGHEAEADAELVKQMCGHLGIPLDSRKVNLPGPGDKKLSEQTLRSLRYECLQQAAAAIGADAIALGHTADDMAETVLMHLLRGSGMSGLNFSFESVSPGMRLVRPLWQTRRVDIVAWLDHQGIEYREDLSNTDVSYTRNRIRHELMPVLKERYNPDIVKALNQTALIAGQMQAFVEGIASSRLQKWVKRCGKDYLSLPWLRRVPVAVQVEVLRQWLRLHLPPEVFLGFDKLQACLHGTDGASGGLVALGGGHWLVCNSRRAWHFFSGEQTDAAPDRMDLARQHARLFPTSPLAVIPDPLEVVEANPAVITNLCGHQVEIQFAVSNSEPGKRNFHIRNRIDGDTVSGHGKLKEILINDKVPSYLRDFLLLVTDEDNQIVAIAGMKRFNARLTKQVEIMCQHLTMKPEQNTDLPERDSRHAKA